MILTKSNDLHRKQLSLELLEDRTLPAALLPGFVETIVAEGIRGPTSFDIAPDGRVFVTEQHGGLRVIDNGQLISDLVVNVTVGTDSFANERGLLGVVVDPDFEVNNTIYLYYTLPSNDTNRISRFVLDGNTAISESEAILLEVPSGDHHNGGGMKFGPDGKLYIGTGDANDPPSSQSLSSLNGKMLRINPDGTIPEDNPFFSTLSGEFRAIWAYGFRNPFTFAFGPDGQLFINDVGQSSWEEINEGIPGANYGWPLSEGPTDDPQFTSPIYAYPHDFYPPINQTWAAIVGGDFYMPPEGVVNFPSEYTGNYFFGDYIRGWVRARDAHTGEVSEFLTDAGFLTGLQFAADGSLYYITPGPRSGALLRVTYDPESPPVVATNPFDVLTSAGSSASFEVKAHGLDLHFQWLMNGVEIPDANGPTFTLQNVGLSDSGSKFSVRLTNSFGVVTSTGAILTVLDDQPPELTINLGEDILFYGGQTISFSGHAIDPETVELPPESFTWRVDYITGGAIRPVLPSLIGVTGGEFVVPVRSPYTLTDVSYRITFTATDPAGLSRTITREILPQIVTIQLHSDFTNSITLDGSPVPLPHSFSSVVGFVRQLSAKERVRVGDQDWTFEGWSNENPRTHDLVIPAQNSTYRTSYIRLVEEPPLTPDSEELPVPPLPSLPIIESLSSSLAVSSGPGINPVIRLFGNTGELLRISPFPDGFTGGARVASGDLTGDGVPDLIVVPGPGGGPVILRIDGSTGEIIGTSLAFEESFRGGLFVTAADLTGNGITDYVVSADLGGGPRVRIFDGSTGNTIADFLAIEDPNFRGGARIALGDVNGDGIPDLLVAAGAGGGPRLALFDGAAFRRGNGPVKLLPDFFVFSPDLLNGTFVALGDLDGDGRADIIAGAGPGGAPRVFAISGGPLVASGGIDQIQLANYFAGDPISRAGVHVGARDLDGDGRTELITGAGEGQIPTVDLVRGNRLPVDGAPDAKESFLAFDLDFRGGVFVG